MSVHTKGLLVSLNIGMPPQSKKIKSVSEDVEHQHRTAVNQAAVVTKLYAKQDLAGLQRAVSSARTRFKELTLPYGRSQGLIPAAKYFDFLGEMTELKKNYDSEREYILNNIHSVISNAKDVNGTLYDSENYPCLNELESAMYFSIEVNPVPAANEFDKLSDLSEEEKAFLKKESVLSNQNMMESAIKDLFGRLLKTLKHASERLDDEDGGCKIFRDTVVGNINKAIEAAETLNLNDDEQLTQLTEAVKEIVDGINSDDLRKDKNLRAETAKKAAELVSRIEGLF